MRNLNRMTWSLCPNPQRRIYSARGDPASPMLAQHYLTFQKHRVYLPWDVPRSLHTTSSPTARRIPFAFQPNAGATASEWPPPDNCKRVWPCRSINPTVQIVQFTISRGWNEDDKSFKEQWMTFGQENFSHSDGTFVWAHKKVGLHFHGRCMYHADILVAASI